MKITPSFHSPELTYKNRYCGPSALSSITGLSIECCAAWVRHLTGAKSVKGMTHWEMKQALNHLQVDWVISTESKGLTLNQWYNQEHGKIRTFLIDAGRHFVIVDGRYLLDNQEKKILFCNTKHKRKRITRTYEIVRGRRYEKDFWPPNQSPIEKKEIQTESQKARKLMKEMKCEIDGTARDFNDGVNLDPPPYHYFKYEGNHSHLCFSWEDILLYLENGIKECPQDCECRD